MGDMMLSKRETRIRNTVWFLLFAGSSFIALAVLYGLYWVGVGLLYVLNWVFA